MLRFISCQLGLVVLLTNWTSVGAEDPTRRFQDFTADPHWESYRSRLLPKPIPITRQDFGWCDQRAGRSEICGRVQRSLTPAWFAKVIPARTLNDRLSASGKFAVSRDEGNSGTLFGWFNETSRGWRTPNSLAFRIDGNGGKYWIFFEYGTRHWLTGGGGCFEGERYQTTKTKPFRADGTEHTWSLDYDPNGANGNGLIAFVLDGTTYTRALSPGHKADGAEFNRFGVFNQQNSGGGMEVSFRNLKKDEQVIGSSDGEWEGHGNRVQFADRQMRPFHDFGWSPAAKAGGKLGELGGIIWRDEKPAYYADTVEVLTLEDELFASGKMAFNGAGSDSGVYLGWFNSNSKTNKTTADHEKPPANMMAILIEGPSRIGHYFRAEYRTARGSGTSDQSGPIIRPDGSTHQWSIRYSPGSRKIVVQFDDRVQTLLMDPNHRKEGAMFDRFGLFNIQSGGHFVDVAFDDVTYTAKSK
jgi:hypothetical protein